MSHVSLIDEIRATEAQLAEAEENWEVTMEFFNDAGPTLSAEAQHKVRSRLRKFAAECNILSAHLGMLEADLEAGE